MNINNYRLLPICMHRQQGVVLVVSLIFLVALTAVTSLLMQNSTLDMKMSGATEDRAIAVQEVVSQVDEIIYDEIKNNNRNNFSKLMQQYPIEVINTDKTKAYLVVNGDYSSIEGRCPRSEKGNSGEIQCNYVRLEVWKKFGRKDNSEISASAGIAQELIAK